MGPNLPEIIAAKNHSNYVLAYVVYVTFNSSQHDGALVRVLERKSNSSALLGHLVLWSQAGVGTESNSIQPRQPSKMDPEPKPHALCEEGCKLQQPPGGSLRGLQPRSCVPSSQKQFKFKYKTVPSLKIIFVTPKPI